MAGSIIRTLLLMNVCMLENKILRKLEEHDKRFAEHNASFDKINRKLTEHDKKFAKHDASFDKIIDKLLEHDQKMDAFVTKDEFYKFRNEVVTGQDKMITILQRLDEERVFTNVWIKDIEGKVNTNATDITDIKLRLKIA